MNQYDSTITLEDKSRAKKYKASIRSAYEVKDIISGKYLLDTDYKMSMKLFKAN